MPDAPDRVPSAADGVHGSQLVVAAEAHHGRIRVAGELDAQTTCLLDAVIEGQVARDRVELCLDVADLTFIDLAGFDALRDARRRLDERGGRLTVARYSPFFARVARICGLHVLLEERQP